jgi:hypothetical protein
MAQAANKRAKIEVRIPHDDCEGCASETWPRGGIDGEQVVQVDRDTLVLDRPTHHIGQLADHLQVEHGNCACGA